MLSIILLASTCAAIPLTPVWPNIFWQNFEETTYYSGIGTHNNTGTYYYNYNTKAYRIDRNNGGYDRYCGLEGPYFSQNTPCSHIVSNGYRYLYYSDLNKCCYCCNSTMGCGVLLPTWMDNSNFIDTEIHNGVLAYKWEKSGLQPNYFYETTGDDPVKRVTLSIYQINDDYMDFGPRSETLPPNILDLPSICTLTNTCDWGFCQQLRN